MSSKSWCNICFIIQANRCSETSACAWRHVPHLHEPANGRRVTCSNNRQCAWHDWLSNRNKSWCLWANGSRGREGVSHQMTGMSFGNLCSLKDNLPNVSLSSFYTQGNWFEITENIITRNTGKSFLNVENQTRNTENRFKITENIKCSKDHYLKLLKR